MKQPLEIDEETLSMSLILRDVLPCDFDATEELINEFAKFVQSYARFLDAEGDPTPNEEERFGVQLESILRILSNGSSAIDSIVNSVSPPVR